jgi:hypothetical protein
MREGGQHVDTALLRHRLEAWSKYGVTPRALCLAAGLSEDALQEAVRTGRRVLKNTHRSLMALTWDDLDDTALVNAELTRQRVYSMMAAGHSLVWICERVDGLNVGGKWRQQDRIKLGLARGVMRLYHEAPLDGPSRQTATKARRAGAAHPLAWDDPGIPAAETGWTLPPVEVYTAADRAEAICDLAELGLGVTEATRRLHVSRDALQQWCLRNGLSNVYRRLAAREALGENQTTREDAIA